MSGGPAVLTTRISAMSKITIAAFVVLVAQLWYLHILDGPRLRERSEQNRIRVRSVPERGGMGGKVAAPLARQVFEAIFHAPALDDRGA